MYPFVHFFFEFSDWSIDVLKIITPIIFAYYIANASFRKTKKYERAIYVKKLKADAAYQCELILREQITIDEDYMQFYYYKYAAKIVAGDSPDEDFKTLSDEYLKLSIKHKNVQHKQKAELTKVCSELVLYTEVSEKEKRIIKNLSNKIKQLYYLKHGNNPYFNLSPTEITKTHRELLDKMPTITRNSNPTYINAQRLQRILCPDFYNITDQRYFLTGDKIKVVVQV